MKSINFNLLGEPAFICQLLSGMLLLICSVTSAFSQSADVFPVPDTYKTEGIPAIKNSEVKHLFYDQSLIRSNLIWDADLKNRRLLVTDETNNIYLLDKPLSRPVKMFDKIFPHSVKINPKGDSFVFMSDHENEDNYQLYLFNFKENTQKKLTASTGKDESISSFAWRETGDSLFYTKVDYDLKTSKLCRNDFHAEKCNPDGFNGVWDVMQVEMNNVLLKYWKASSSQYLYVYDLKTNKLMPIDENGNSRKAFIIDNRVFWTSEGNENCKKEPCLLTLHLKTKALSQVEIPDDISIINDLKISSDGNNLMIQETRDGIDRLRIFRLKEDRIVKEFPPFISGSYVIWHTRWLSDSEIVYTLENNGKPASIQSYELDTKKVTNWTEGRLPPRLEGKVKPTEMIKWKSFDQKEIPGYVIRPINTEKKNPVLINVHGGPQILVKPIFNLQDLILSSSLGLTIIHTNIRGSSGFGKEFMDADNKEKRGDAVKDIRALIDWIGNQSDLDKDRIYLKGESYGGFVALSAALQEPLRIKGVIAEYPLVSIRGLLSQDWINEIAKNEYGDPKDENLMSKLDALSPLNNTERWNDIPLFLTRGKLDERNPEKNVIDLKNQLQNKGTELWFIYSNESGHGFGGDYVFAAMYQFLKKQITEEK
jgi:dipeptidyl aminopeptidase/acylaminoacyl peptidase